MSKILRICEVCGAEFLVNPGRLRQSPARYCSMACRTEAWSGEGNPNWKGGPEIRTCLECGSTFERIMSPSVVSGGGGKFCSRACFDVWRTKHGKGSDHKNWRSKIVEKICPVCGKTFQVQIAPCGVGDNKFCSHECWREGRVGAGNPYWKDGRSLEPYPPEFNKRFRKMIRERDGNRCQACHATEEQNGRSLDVHHIDGDKQNSSLDNLITLCRNCHSRIHGMSPSPRLPLRSS